MAFPLFLVSVIHSLFAGQRQAFRRARSYVLAPPRELGFQFSPLDFEGRWSAERRALVVKKSAFRTLHRGIYG
jgi:hypothetical protein